MAKRYNALTVLLWQDASANEAESIMTTIARMRGVLRVDGTVVDAAAHAAYELERKEFYETFWALARPWRAK